MINEKQYYKLMHQLPALAPHKDINKIILSKCSFPKNNLALTKNNYLFDGCYTIACICIIMFILTFGYSSESFKENQYKTIAYNSHQLVGQLSSGIYDSYVKSK